LPDGYCWCASGATDGRRSGSWAAIRAGIIIVRPGKACKEAFTLGVEKALKVPLEVPSLTLYMEQRIIMLRRRYGWYGWYDLRASV
jgi:hypothetical protein